VGRYESCQLALATSSLADGWPVPQPCKECQREDEAPVGHHWRNAGLQVGLGWGQGMKNRGQGSCSDQDEACCRQLRLASGWTSGSECTHSTQRSRARLKSPQAGMAPPHTPHSILKHLHTHTHAHTHTVNSACLPLTALSSGLEASTFRLAVPTLTQCSRYRQACARRSVCLS